MEIRQAGSPRSSKPWMLGLILAVLLAACSGGASESATDAATEPGSETRDATDDAGSDGEDAGSDGEAVPDETIKIATPLPLTGPAAPFGIPYLEAMQMTVDRINAAGGIASLGGAQLELLVADDEGNAERDAELIREMAAEGAVAAAGPLTSATVIATAPLLGELQIPLVAPSMDNLLTESDFDYYFRIVQKADVWGEQLVSFLKEQMDAGAIDVERVGIVAMNVPPGTSVSAALEEGVRELGLEPVVISYDAASTRDYASIVAQLREADVDIVTGHQYPNDAVLMAEAVALQDWRPSEGFVWVSGGHYLNSFTESMGESIENWIVLSYMAPETDVDITVELAAEYQERTGESLVGLAGSGPAVIGAIAAALEAAGEANGPAVREALTKLEYSAGENYYTMAGGVQFNEVQENAAWEGAFVQLAGDGRQVAVAPQEYAIREPVWPAHDLR